MVQSSQRKFCTGTISCRSLDCLFSLDDKEIYYCDSLAGRIAEAVWKQIADIAFTSESTLSVNISPVHQQKNSIDCGVFAVAFLVDALFGVTPVGQKFDIAKMRKHLLSCLVEETFSPFPRTEKGARPTERWSVTRMFFVFVVDHFSLETPKLTARCSWLFAVNARNGITESVCPFL